MGEIMVVKTIYIATWTVNGVTKTMHSEFLEPFKAAVKLLQDAYPQRTVSLFEADIPAVEVIYDVAALFRR